MDLSISSKHAYHNVMLRQQQQAPETLRPMSRWAQEGWQCNSRTSTCGAHSTALEPRWSSTALAGRSCSFDRIVAPHDAWYSIKPSVFSSVKMYGMNEYIFMCLCANSFSVRMRIAAVCYSSLATWYIRGIIGDCGRNLEVVVVWPSHDCALCELLIFYEMCS